MASDNRKIPISVRRRLSVRSSFLSVSESREGQRYSAAIIPRPVKLYGNHSAQEIANEMPERTVYPRPPFAFRTAAVSDQSVIAENNNAGMYGVPEWL